ncbi:hypothetical protein GCM10011344_22870 [Dokdonia pacifica]|nr:hypothetical protein GCM10011344_22870 [Dokdonia pacifica]
MRFHFKNKPNMKKITLLLCLFAVAAFGQNPLTLQEYVDAGLQKEVATIDKPDGSVASIQARGANVTTFDDRDDYLANCSNGDMLILEDFAGGPGALIGCGEILSSAGDTCYPAGELQEGFEITVNTPGNVTVYLDPADGFGTLDPAVGSNTFTDFTVINFTGADPVTSTGFDLYSLTGGSSVDIRVIGEGGLIDTVTVDVTSTGPVFVGILAAETIVSLELEDLSGANVELVAQLLYGTCAPPPLNDDPETAASLTVGLVFEDFPVIADNTEATATAIDDPSCGNFTEADLWYSFVVPDSGSVTVESQEDDGSITDTAISIYEGEIGSLVEVVCNDDGGIGLFSLAEVEGRTPGEVLYARVWEWNGGSLGTFQMSAYDTPPPTNDDPEGAIPLTLGAVFTDFPVTASNVSATDTAIDDPSCGNYGGADVWFTVVPPSTGQLTIETDTAGGITDTGMALYSGEIGALVEIGCDDDGGNGLFSLVDLTDQEPGAVLYVRVWEWGGGGFGPFQVAAYSNCPVNAAEIETSTGDTEVSICVGDDMPDPIDVTIVGDPVGTNNGWIITDNATGEILGLPMAPPFDLDGVEPGVCAVYYVRYEDGLVGLDMGANIGDLDGCFDLSNPILIDRVDEGGVCEMCEYTLEMNDSFGDGWNGAIMDVLVDGVVVLDDVSLDDDPNNDGVQGILTFPVNSTADVTTMFIDGGGFPGEVSYRILDVNGIEVASGTADPATDIMSGTLTADCPSCVAPQNLMAGNFMPGTVDISWDPFMDALGYIWEIQDQGVPQGTPDPIASGSTIDMTTDSAVGPFISGNFYTLYVQSFCTEDDSSIFVSIDFQFLLPPPNDDCEEAIALECGTTVAGTTLGGMDSGQNPSADVFYTYTGNGATEFVTLSLCDGLTTYDSFIRVFDDGCELVNEIAFNDDFCGLQSQVTFTSDGTTTYTIMVEGFGASVGDFSLAVSCEEAAPPGECEYTLEMFDSFGDGWNGATINVLRDGLIILNGVSLDDDPANDGTTGSIPFEINPGEDITTVLVTPGGFPEEISYNILAVDGTTVIASGDADNNIESGTLTSSCTLSVEENTLEGFNFFPNPVQDVINLDARTGIENVTMFNLLGQKVLEQKVDGSSTYQLNVSTMAKGTYLMQVTSNGVTGVYRVIKK